MLHLAVLLFFFIFLMWLLSWLLFFNLFFTVVLGVSTLWHWQKFLKYIKYTWIHHSTTLLYPQLSPFLAVSKSIIFAFTHVYIVFALLPLCLPLLPFHCYLPPHSGQDLFLFSDFVEEKRRKGKWKKWHFWLW
jgi:hypothetical protein